ncbi:MAG: hypothetical protein RMX97_30735 [Nostoc sp. DedQUE11]|nr:hypothetical protein [Nostoc sp. DedQUE11]
MAASVAAAAAALRATDVGGLSVTTSFTITVIDSGNGKGNIVGGDGNDYLAGGNGKDNIFGDAGNGYLAGGNGADTLRGGLGNYILNGGLANDVFVLAAGEGTDTIQDFVNSNDKIGLANGLTYQQLMFSQEGDRVKISLTSTGEVLAYLNNFTLNLLDLNDFVLA